MKLSVCILFVSILGLAGLQAQVLRGTPKIKCDDPVFEFGTVDNTEEVENTFILRNEGNAVLNISEVKATCGCTIAKVSSKVLQPGEEAKIDAVLKLKGRRGLQNKVISVYSNDANTPKLVLSMKGTAMPLILAEPFMISFGNISPGQALEAKKVTLTAREGQDFKITKIEALRKTLDITYTTLEEGKRYEISVTPKSTSDQARFYDQIRVHTNLPNLPVMDISASGKVIGAIEVIPESLYLTPRGDRAIPPRYVMIAPGTQKNFKVSKVEWPGENVEATVLPLNSTAGFRGYRVVLKNIIPTQDLNGKKLIIHTNVVGKETIEVPLVVRKPLTSLQP